MCMSERDRDDACMHERKRARARRMHAGGANNGRDRVSKKTKQDMTATSENVSVKVLERTETSMIWAHF